MPADPWLPVRRHWDRTRSSRRSTPRARDHPCTWCVLAAGLTLAAVDHLPAFAANHFVLARSPKVGRHSLLDGLFGASNEPEPPSSLVAPPSWEDLQSKLADASTPEELGALAEVEAGRGPLRADRSKVRLFGAVGPPEVRVRLYRDDASWCPYCEKVQLALEEKQVPYFISKVNMNCYGDKPFDFLAKNPMGLLPVAEIDGQLITESNSILDILEAKFPARSLVPAGRESEVNSLLRLERRLFSSWFSWLRSPGNDDGNRRFFLEDLDVVEQQLKKSGGPYFLGASFSMVECHFASFLERMAASLAYFKGFKMRHNPDYPCLEAWFAAMEKLDSYRALASDFYTHAHDLPPQVGGCADNGKNEELRCEIDGVTVDGKDADSWRLPLPVDVPPTPLQPLLENTAEEAEAARREAARKLLGNRAAVVKFCLRGRGQRGFPPVGAPLSDPRASPSGDGQLSASVDEALRSIAAHLLSGGGEAVLAEGVGPEAWRRRGDMEACLGYLRDRIGVPRDMSFPAARQFRAHINSYIEAVGTA